MVTLDLIQGDKLKNLKASGKEVGAGDISFSEVTKLISKAYLGNEIDSKDPLVSPINMHGEIIKSFPRTFIITDEIYPLKNHGEALANLLGTHNIDVYHLHYPNIPHAFLNETGIVPQAQDCAWEIKQWLD